MKLTKIVIKDLTDYVPEFLGGSFYSKFLSPKIVHDEGYIIDFTGCTYLGWGFMRDLYIINKYRGGLVVTGLNYEMLNCLLKFWNSIRNGNELPKHEDIVIIDRRNLKDHIFD